MACRSIERATAAANEIKETIEIDDNKLLVRELDLGSLESVRAFVEKFKSGLGEIMVTSTLLIFCYNSKFQRNLN